jgi:hypothetical protein
VSEEHRGLLGDVRDLATQLEQLALQAAARVAPIETPSPTEDEQTRNTVPTSQPE